MKKTIIITLMLCLTQLLAAKPSYILKVKFPPATPVQLRGYYKGNIITLDEGWHALPESEDFFQDRWEQSPGRCHRL